MKGSRTPDNIKNKIIKEKLKNPSATAETIANKTWVSTATVTRIAKEFPEQLAKSWLKTHQQILNDLQKTIDKVNRINEIALENYEQDALQRKLRPWETKALNEIAEIAFKRQRLLWWEVTERVELVDLSNKSQKELEELRKQVL